MRRKGRATLSDIAARAGVSIATVSYVLNDTPNQSMRPETREKVLAAAARVGYTRSAAARTLARGRSDFVVLAVPDLPVAHVLIGMMERLTAACAEIGLHLLARFTPAGEELTHLCRELSPTAVIVLIDDGTYALDRVQELGLAAPITVWSTLPPGTRVAGSEAAPLVDLAAVGRVQAEVVVAEGHTRLGLVFPWDPRLDVVATQRLAGAVQLCSELGLPAPRELRSGGRAPDANDVREWVDDGITAVCTYNDEVALAVLAAAQRARVAVPEELAVIGVDDIPAARFSEPRLSSVELLVETICARVMAAVATEAGTAAPQAVPLDEPDLLVHRRETTASPVRSR